MIIEKESYFTVKKNIIHDNICFSFEVKLKINYKDQTYSIFSTKTNGNFIFENNLMGSDYRWKCILELINEAIDFAEKKLNKYLMSNMENEKHGN